MGTAVIATLEAQKETGVSNTIFEWVNFLFENKSKIDTYDRVIAKHKRLWREAHSLKPKHPLLDDTAYQRKLKEAQEHSEVWEKLSKPYLDKFIELGFVEKYGSYKNSLQDILDKWVKYSTDNAISIEQLKECKKKYKHLQNGKVKSFIDYNIIDFFDSLDVVLTEMFDTVLGNKYQALADDLEPYLEQHYKELNCQVLESIIEMKQLPIWVKYKPIWTKQAHAIAFLDYMGWKPNEVKGLFDYRDGKGKVIETTTVTKRSKKPNSELLAIFKKHIHK